ncbi:gliding motility lipoprotein GldB [Zunongwangia endophytica]|uniref:Gliding motility lipoprotein GldB n=1 Tax=Zunongwangia endophytica TaxID=1808945 RepID=A0ABV8H269_9FLAO|nr:gliding motility lipoprotein GldB [Zunongwangia endophytica]MDN3596480.1 gliding motility lipoprotein GldB [Zunongwangia endophytica]
MMNRILFVFFLFLSLISCDSASEREKEIEKIPVDFEVVRFDKLFAEASPQSLPQLKEDYPYLFPKQFPDSVWVNKMKDTIQQEIKREVEKKYPEFSETEDEFYSLFQHIKYYFPEFEVPDVITVTSEVDYKNKIIYTGDYVFVSLDTYLGEDHKFYVGIVEYFTRNFKKDQIVPDAANDIAENYIPKPASRTFLANMIYYGKILYLKDIWLPKQSNWRKIGYTQEQWGFAENNEEMVWRYFVDNELIFDTDANLAPRFLYPAPFSKFYLSLDAETPDRLGQYIGWQMVKSYMNKNEVSIQQMLKTDAETIFNNANYKPKK